MKIVTIFKIMHLDLLRRRLSGFMLRGRLSPIFIDYSVNPEPRYGWGKPPHNRLYNIINTRRDNYLDVIKLFAPFSSGMRSIPAHSGTSIDLPYWSNSWLQGLDAITLYSFPAIFNSKIYIEIGSGISTKFVRKSIIDNGLPTKIVSIDPSPRAEVEAQCDTSIRQSLENVDLDFAASLNAGDILMLDGSHRCFQNSDVHVFFLEILPELRPGVLIFIHDIFLPYDYRPEWREKWYSEQYLLAVLLLNDLQHRYEIIFPGLFVDKDPELRAAAEKLWDGVNHEASLPNGATGFWMCVRKTQ